MNIQKIKIEVLKPVAYNPRKDLQPSDAEYQKIKRSIETYGYIDPIIVNSDYTIIGGHQRLKVLKDLGFEEVECVIVDLDKDHEKSLANTCKTPVGLRCCGCKLFITYEILAHPICKSN